MELSSLVSPIVVAVIGAIALLLAGGQLTAKARLRRKLDQDLAIVDKLPAGQARTFMDTLVRRHAAELYCREVFGVAGLLGTVSAIAVLGLAVSGWAYLTKSPEVAVDLGTVLFAVTLGGVLVVMLVFMGISYQDRLKYVAKHSEESADTPP